MPRNVNRKNNKKTNKRANRMNLMPSTRTQGSLVEAIPRNLPIPNNIRVTLKYADYYLLASSAGIAYAVYSGNNIYDPDVTFTGHQPYYFDKYAALYTYYTVLGSKMLVNTNVDLGSNQSVMFGIIAYKNNGVNNTAAGLQEIMESRYGKSKLFINNPVQTYPISLGQRSSTMLSTSTSELMINPIYRASVTGAPTEEWYYKILALNGDASTTSFSLAISIQIEYDVIFTQPKDEPPSFKTESVHKGVRRNVSVKPQVQEEEVKSNSSFETIRGRGVGR